MSRFFHGPRRGPLPIRFDRYSDPATLHEAKLASWALAAGARLPQPGAPPRRLHRGMLPDMPPPEQPTPRAARPPLSVRLLQALKTVFGAGKAAAPAAAPAATVADGSNITYIDLTGAGAAAAKAAGDAQPVRSRAA